MKVQVKLLLLYSMLYHCFCTSVSDVFITNVKMNVPQGASVHGNMASNVNIIRCCKRAVPPNRVIFSGTNIHCWLHRSPSCTATENSLKWSRQHSKHHYISPPACSAQQLWNNHACAKKQACLLHLFEILIFLLFVFFVHVSSLKKIYQKLMSIQEIIKHSLYLKLAFPQEY